MERGDFEESIDIILFLKLEGLHFQLSFIELIKSHFSKTGITIQDPLVGVGHNCLELKSWNIASNVKIIAPN